VTGAGEFTPGAIGTAIRDAGTALGGALALCVALVAAGESTPAGAAGAALGLGIVGAAGGSVVARPGRWSGPADRVTLLRAALIAGCATVSLPMATGHLPARSWPFLALAVPALLLDAVDGAVARRSATATAAGGRLDGELDAAMLLVLSLAAAPTVGWWVLAIGLMRYGFLIAGYLRPALAEPLAFSQFRRVVAALQGIALAVAPAPVVPVEAGLAAAGLALALLTISFGRDVIHLERRPRRP
jgi:phosphatidylglycerophosphate synthase